MGSFAADIVVYPGRPYRARRLWFGAFPGLQPGLSHCGPTARVAWPRDVYADPASPPHRKIARTERSQAAHFAFIFTASATLPSKWRMNFVTLPSAFFTKVKGEPPALKKKFVSEEGESGSSTCTPSFCQKISSPF